MLIFPQAISFSRMGSLTILLALGDRLKMRKKIPGLSSRVSNERTSAGEFILFGLSVGGDVVNTKLIILRDARLIKGLREVSNDVGIDDSERFEDVLVVDGESEG
jgi:hypothetical protein